MSLYFSRGGAEGSAGLMASVSSDGAQAAYRSASDTSMVYPVVDNQNFSYYLELVIPPTAGTNIKLTNVRIDYEYASDLIVLPEASPEVSSLLSALPLQLLSYYVSVARVWRSPAVRPALATALSVGSYQPAIGLVILRKGSAHEYP